MSARGRASERGVEKGSGAGHPRKVVELLLLKKLCRFPPPGSLVLHNKILYVNNNHANQKSQSVKILLRKKLSNLKDETRKS